MSAYLNDNSIIFVFLGWILERRRPNIHFTKRPNAEHRIQQCKRLLARQSRQQPGQCDIIELDAMQMRFDEPLRKRSVNSGRAFVSKYQLAAHVRTML